MAVEFIGRQKELKSLKQAMDSKSATLAVIKGRRRIGKSTLVEQFGKKYKFFEFAGLAPEKGVTSQDQKDAFLSKLARYFGTRPIKLTDWADIFYYLDQNLPKEPCVVLFDEISWMVSEDPTFLPNLKDAWDTLFKKRNNFMLVLCSSISIWIEKNILNSTAFFGRVGLSFTLGELSLKESILFIRAVGLRTPPAEMLKILSVFGGIPWYLELLKANLTADENIKNLCFIKSGVLVEEYNRIFENLFSKRGTIYKEIIDGLSSHDLTLKEIETKTKYPRSGSLGERLNLLIESGFVNKYNSWRIKQEKIGKQSLYHLSDPYLRFYVKYIQPNLPRIENNSFEYKKLYDLPEWSSIMGLQLETLLLKNRSFLWEQLNIHPQDIVWDNPYFKKSSSESSGLQIDYLIQTRQKVIYVCEIKFSRQPIGVEVKKEVEKKIESLDIPKGFSVCPVLINTSSVTDYLLDTNFFFRIINLTDELP